MRVFFLVFIEWVSISCVLVRWPLSPALVCDLNQSKSIETEMFQVFKVEAASLSILWSSICRRKLPAHAQPSHEILLIFFSLSLIIFLSLKIWSSESRGTASWESKIFHATASAVADGYRIKGDGVYSWHNASRWSVTSQVSRGRRTPISTWLPWPARFQPRPLRDKR